MLEKNGYGQVEIQKLTAQVTGELVSQCKLSDEAKIALKGLVNQGIFLTQNNKNEYVIPTDGGDETTVFIYNEIRNYIPWQLDKDYVMKADEHIDGVCYPRGYVPSTTDVFTTNMIDLGTKTYDTLAEGDAVRIIGGILTVADAAVAEDKIAYTIDKVYTMPDGQKGIKVRCVKAHA